MPLPIIDDQNPQGFFLFVVGASLWAVVFCVAILVGSPAEAAAKQRTATEMSVVFRGSERTVAAGSSGFYSFNVALNGTLSSPIRFDIPDLPSGTTATVVAVSGTEHTLTIATTLTATGGTAVYAIRAQAGKLTHIAEFRLTVVRASCLAPSTVTASPAIGTSGTVVSSISPSAASN
jgi:hypothetical protein